MRLGLFGGFVLWVLIVSTLAGCSVDYHVAIGYHGKTARDDNMNFKTKSGMEEGRY